MKKVFFTIIIPVFNSDKFIRKCISSIVNQNFQDFEVLIINDGSTDKSKKICQKFLLENPTKIKLFNNKRNLGVGVSRNVGLKSANGKYIIFLDSDDYLIKNSLNSLQKKIKIKDYPDVVLNHIVQNKEPKSNIVNLNFFGKKKLSKKQFLAKLLEKNLLINECWRIVVSNNLIQNNKIVFKNIKIAEDVSFIFKIFILMKNITINEKKFLFHSSRLNSLKYTKGVDSALAYYVVFLELQEYKKKFKKDKKIINFLNFKSNNMITNIRIYFTLLNRKEIIKLKNKFNKIKDFKKNIVDKKKFILSIINDSEKKVVNFLKLKKTHGQNITIYCAGIMTQSIIKILKKNDIQVKNIIDDDPMWIGRKLMNINVEKISILNNSNKKNNLIMICNLSKKVINNIKIKLLKLKLNNKQILSFSL
jgi:glycosyltransferase involved in cell wall biosynthesis